MRRARLVLVGLRSETTNRQTVEIASEVVSCQWIEISTYIQKITRMKAPTGTRNIRYSVDRSMLGVCDNGLEE